MSSFSRRIIVLIGLCGLAGLAWSQSNNAIRPKGNSPYSRFGLGDLSGQYFAAAGGMGGLTAALQDPFHLHMRNPASLASLQSTAFEVGFSGKYAHLQDASRSSDIWSGNLDYLALGFPLLNPISKALDKRTNSPWNFGMSLSLQPYTTVGYDIRAEVDYGGEVQGTTNIFKGNGGTYSFQWGNAVQYKKLSAGVSLGYLLGKITSSRRVEFDSLELAYSSDFLDEISVNGFIWNAGVQYRLEFGGKDRNQVRTKRLIFGLYGNSATPFSTNSSRLYTRDNLFNAPDTVLSEVRVRNTGTLPMQLTAGILYEQINKWRIGAEYSFTQWSAYENQAKPENLVNAARAAIGVEYIPEYNSYDSFLRRWRYRAGLVYATDPRTLNSDQLRELSVSMGIGIPLIMPRQQISFVNMSIEAGQFGLPNAIKENFVRMTLGVTLNDNTWFFKRKFN
ncbi:MAG TPA: hypothetical protein PKC76_11845 [Saprospiraceae bacterium]|nr:hypothetical protein [Saprospiraceae bacterium]HMP24820.1 hypothetical protein [Saprospiraceae bacterium]